MCKKEGKKCEERTEEIYEAKDIRGEQQRVRTNRTLPNNNDWKNTGQ